MISARLPADAKPFVETALPSKYGADMTGLRCTECEVIKIRRKDSLCFGLHSFTCVGCGHTSTQVVTLEGKLKEQTAEDHKSK